MSKESSDYYQRRPGDLIFCSHGAYADYTVDGVFRIVQAVDLAHEAARYVAHQPTLHSFNGRPYKQFAPDEFLQSLMQRGILEPVPTDEIHLGEYDRLPEWAKEEKVWKTTRSRQSSQP